MQRIRLAAVILVAASGCATPRMDAGYGGVDRFQYEWTGKTLEQAKQVFGEPDAEPNAYWDTYAWDEAGGIVNCAVRLDVDSTNTISAVRISPSCPSASKMEELGWISPLETRGLAATYDKFYQVYRIGTRPTTKVIGADGGFVELSFVAGYHRDRPDNMVFALVLRTADQQGATPRGASGALDIPVSDSLMAEARVLLDGEDVFSAMAVEELPLRGLTSARNYLSVVLTRQTVERLLRAETVEVLLPSGATLDLAPEEVRRIKRALYYVSEPDRLQELISESEMNADSATGSQNE